MLEIGQTEKGVIEKLKIALGLVDTLKQENQVYKSNFDHLKTSYDLLYEKNESISKEYEITQREKNSIEQEVSDVQNKLKAVIEQQAVEIEGMRSKVKTTRDIELMKLQIFDEYETGSKKTWKAFENEIEKMRLKYTKLQKEYDVLSSESEREKHEFKAQIDDLKDSHSEDLDNLESKMHSLKSSLDAASDTERLRTLQRENHELQQKVISLIAELEEVRAEKETNSVNFEQESRLFQRRLLDESANGKQLGADRDAMKAKISSLEQELKELVYSNERYLEESQRDKKELHNLNSKLESITHQHTVETGDTKIEHLKQTSHLQTLLQDHQKKHLDQVQTLKLQTEQTQELRHQLSLCDRDFLEKLRRVKEEDYDKIGKLEHEKNEVERKLALAKVALKEFESREEGVRKECQNEVLKARQKLKQFTDERDSLGLRYADVGNEIAKLKVENEGLKKSLVDNESHRALIQDELDSKNGVETALHEKLRNLELDLKAKNEEVSKSDENMEKEMNAFQHNLERQSNSWSNEKSQLHQSLIQIKSENERLEDTNRQLSDVFEQQQVLFKTKLSSLKGKAKEYRSEATTLRQSLQTEVMKSTEYERIKKLKEHEFIKMLKSENIF